MKIDFTDKVSVKAGSVRRTQDGYLVADVLSARTGIQLYNGSEVGLPDKDVVRVYRPPEVVFHEDTMRSCAYRPLTVDHPRDGVTAENWMDLARGFTGGEVARDGDFLRIPLAIMDAGAIKTVEDGKQELSWGYGGEIEFTDGVSPAGEKYDAIQTSIKMNHLAIVDAARGGSSLRIGDNEEEPSMANKIVMVDGLQVETTEAGAAAIDKLQRDLLTARTQSATDLALRDSTITDLRKQVETKDGEAAIMKKKIEDSAMTPAKLQAAVVARTAVITDAKKIAGEDIVTTDKTDAEIRRSAIAKRIGDEAAKLLSDEAISGAFALAAKDAGAGASHQHDNGGVQPLRMALADQQSYQASEDAADKSYEAYVKGLEDAYKTPATVQ